MLSTLVFVACGLGGCEKFADRGNSLGTEIEFFYSLLIEPLAKFIRIAGPNKATARYEEF
jgi:hypothetical protein